ncbi:MAG: penicillin-binding transpeptidase domain-containing protein [Polyangiaceae bacterium]
MRRWLANKWVRRGIAVGAAGVVVAVTVPYVKKHTSDLALSKKADDGGPKIKRNVTPPPLTGIDLTRIDARGDVVTAPGPNDRVAELTLVPKYQRAANRLLREGAVPMGAVVLTDVKTGRILVWANYSEDAPLTNIAAEANSPSASVFKIVTGSALVEHGVGPTTKECYHGGKSRIDESEIARNEKKDKYCATLAEAMGRSLNVIFARLANENLDKDALTSIATRYGWGREVPFDVPIAQSKIEFPDDPIELARSAAGFWHTTLSPFQAVNLATTVANGGEMIRLKIVDKVRDAEGEMYEGATARQVLDRAVDEKTARAVTTMMEATIESGTSYKSFHDRAGRSYLPNIRVAGKTGTLQENKKDGYLYTWFVGFAPADAPEIAISVLAANHSSWKVKATTVGAEMMRVYFADKGRPGVTDPLGAQAKRD